MATNQKRYSVLATGLICFVLAFRSINAQTTSNSYPVNQQIPIGGSGTYYVQITGAPANAVITNVEAMFSYIAYGVVQNYVSARFNRGSDPGPSGGAVLVSQGSLPAGNPGTYGWISFSNWNGQGVNTNYYFRFAVASGSPFTATINTIYVRVTYVVPPSPPSLSSPTDYGIFNRSQTSSITFQWGSVSGASSYWLYVFPAGNSGNPKFNGSVGNVTSYVLSTSGWSDGEYTWLVRAGNVAGWGDYSTSRRFIADTPPPSPTITAPANGASFNIGGSTTFSWNAPSGVTIARYYLRIVPGSNFNGTPVYDPELTSTSQAVTFNSPPYSAGSHIWSVRAIKVTPSGYDPTTYETTIGWGNYASTRTFSLSNPQLPDLTISATVGSSYTSGQTGVQIPVTVYRTGGQLTQGPYVDAHLFWSTNSTWEPSDTRLWRSFNSSPYDFPSSYLNTNGSRTVTATINVPSVANGTYYIIAVVDSSNFHPESNENNNKSSYAVSISSPTPVPTLTYPPNGGGVGFDLTPDLAWTHENAVRFWGQIDNNSDFSSLEGENTNIQALNWTPTLTSYGVYYWRIKALGPNNVWSDWSSVWSFTVGALAPTLELPTSSQTVTTPEIDFQWSNVHALRYELYVDNNPGFGSPEVSPLSIPAFNNFTNVVYTLTRNWLSQNTYYWKVKAYFQSGPPMESSVGTFTYLPPRDASPSWVPVYRAYHPTDVDHFYCTNSNHLAQAQNGGYIFEKVDGYLAINPFQASGDLRAVFRFYNSQDMSHYYTVDENDRDDKIIAGWKYEGITGYGYATPRPALTKFYYLYLDNATTALRDHFYTISSVERENALSRGYQERTFNLYASANGDSLTESWMHAQMLAGDGVNTANGNFNHYTKTSFSIPGTRMSLDFAHMYNSYSTGLLSLINPLGPGWSHTYHAYVVESQGYIFVVWPDGAVHEYQLEGSTYTRKTPGVYDTFSKISASQYTVRKKDQTVFTFDRPAGTNADYPAMLSSIRDRNNNTISCSYESSGLRRLVSVSHGSRALTFVYHNAPLQRLLWKVQDPIGRTIEFNYGTADTNLISFKDAKGQITTYEYDPNARQDHLLLRIRLPNGNYITNTFSNKKVTSQTGTLSLNFTYAPNQTTIRDASNRQWDHYYIANARSSVISRIAFSGGNNYFYYDDAVHPTLPTRIVDARGNTTTIAYDSQGNEITITQPGNLVHQFSYNATNDLTQYTNPRGNSTSYGYTNGNLTSITDPRGTTNLTYFPNGLINTITDPLGQTSTLGYNAFGNLTSARDNLNFTTSYGYDGVSRLTSVTNPKGQTTEYFYDNNDLIVSRRNALTQTELRSYDANDNLLSISNFAGQLYSFGYNDRELLSSKSNPGLPATTYQYDASGRLTSRTNPDGRVTSYTYDNVGRLQIISSPTLTATIGYDVDHNITSVTTGANNLLFSYDALNRIQTTSDFYGNTVTYSYDGASNIQSITYPVNKTVSYTYYSDDRLQTVQTWTGHTFTYHYRADGSIDHIDYPNGARLTYAYDAASRVIGMTHTKSGGQIICSYSFTLDPIGNHISVTQTEPLAVSNLDPGTTSYSYDGGNRILSAGAVSFTHDNNGNMITRSGTNNATYIYDTENRLTGVSGANTATYVYDIFGHRRSATRNGVTTRYVLDVNDPMSRVLVEQDANGNPLNYYIYGHTLLARIKPDGTIHYYHGDFRGSTIAMTDHAGNITHKYSYGPFGELRASVEADFNPFRYVGGYGVMDEGNGLYFMRARYYDPSLGRFLSEDPVWDVNLYSYGDSNPITLIDPDGLAFEKATDRLRRTLRNVWSIAKEEFPGQAIHYAYTALKGKGKLDIKSLGFSIGGELVKKKDKDVGILLSVGYERVSSFTPVGFVSAVFKLETNPRQYSQRSEALAESIANLLDRITGFKIKPMNVAR